MLLKKLIPVFMLCIYLAVPEPIAVLNRQGWIYEYSAGNSALVLRRNMQKTNKQKTYI